MDSKTVGVAPAIQIASFAIITQLLDATLASAHSTLMMTMYVLLTKIAGKIAGNAFLAMLMKNALYVLRLME
jgi:hypothetical protein